MLNFLHLRWVSIALAVINAKEQTKNSLSCVLHGIVTLSAAAIRMVVLKDTDKHTGLPHAHVVFGKDWFGVVLLEEPDDHLKHLC